jgi:GTP-binding protein
MSFIDKVEVSLIAGKGGDGHRSFRRDRMVRKGGPDGGDGGEGGSVIFEASANTDTLAAFRYDKELKAGDGQAGSYNKKHGKRGLDLIVKVPIGTQAVDEAGDMIADLIRDGQQEVVAEGGSGGFGNAHFVSSSRQAPNFAERGEQGQKLHLILELKLIADVGLVGLPNAGKSTLLSRLSTPDR